MHESILKKIGGYYDVQRGCNKFSNKRGDQWYRL